MILFSISRGETANFAIFFTFFLLPMHLNRLISLAPLPAVMYTASGVSFSGFKKAFLPPSAIRSAKTPV